MEYRTTPLSDTGLSPSQLLMSRSLRSILPCTPDKLAPKSPDLSKVRKNMNLSRTVQKKYHDVGAKTLKPLQNDDSVKIQKQNKSWQPAVVIDKHDPRSYTVRTEDGAQYRRNRRHLLKTNESICQKAMFDSFPDILDNKTNSNILDHTTNKQSSHEKESVLAFDSPKVKVPIKPKIEVQAKSTNDQTGPYVTRSGRVVKPKEFVDV